MQVQVQGQGRGQGQGQGQEQEQEGGLSSREKRLVRRLEKPTWVTLLEERASSRQGQKRAEGQGRQG